mmetsp:Transcript_27474/g.51567  ORF Transcript_27474/g.51567 Transcript_27474/m.51567 type:complete len:80 (-) Transcript_27474:113-352(-)
MSVTITNAVFPLAPWICNGIQVSPTAMQDSSRYPTHQRRRNSPNLLPSSIVKTPTNIGRNINVAEPNSNSSNMICPAKG